MARSYRPARTSLSQVFALITGSGFYDIPELADRRVEQVRTPWGDPVAVTLGTWRGRDICFLPRHGSDHTIPPHGINYRANVAALATVGARAILATAVSGGIDPAMAPGKLVLISDYLNFTTGRPDTFHDGSARPIVADVASPAVRSGGSSGDDGAEAAPENDRRMVRVVHTDMSEPYSASLRAVVRQAAERESIELLDGGVYCTTNGPRFETPAEIRMMRTLGGDLVGMTGYPEVALAVEAGIPYASIGVISNVAAGMSDEALSVDDIVGLIETTAEPLYRLIGSTVELADPEDGPASR